MTEEKGYDYRKFLEVKLWAFDTSIAKWNFPIRLDTFAIPERAELFPISQVQLDGLAKAAKRLGILETVEIRSPGRNGKPPQGIEKEATRGLFVLSLEKVWLPERVLPEEIVAMGPEERMRKMVAFGHEDLGGNELKNHIHSPTDPLPIPKAEKKSRIVGKTSAKPDIGHFSPQKLDLSTVGRAQIIELIKVVHAAYFPAQKLDLLSSAYVPKEIQEVLALINSGHEESDIDMTALEADWALRLCHDYFLQHPEASLGDIVKVIRSKLKEPG